ncbi:hypothetical protein ASG57_25405 [Bradyrhizobium sp. Leaf396]|jgi:hypothetical protein|nr:hypothetical protein ASG57_25405 [Bradyrhizobium sp. Leaf396]
MTEFGRKCAGRSIQDRDFGGGRSTPRNSPDVRIVQYGQFAGIGRVNMEAAKRGFGIDAEKQP